MFRRQLTPEEIADELILEDEEKLLFDTYNSVRYAQNAAVPDEVVNTLVKVTGKR